MVSAVDSTSEPQLTTGAFEWWQASSSSSSLSPGERSTRMYNQYRIIVNVYVVGALCIFGITGNALSVVVLGRDRSIRRTTGFLLQMLAVADTAYLAACLLFQTVKTVHELTDWLPSGVRSGWPLIEPIAWPLASVAQTATVWLVVIVTADRYVAICRPLHAAQYSTLSRVRLAVIICWTSAFIYNLPRFFERTTAYRNTTDTDRWELIVTRTELHDHPVYTVIYRTTLYFLARFLVPFSALAFFNTRLIMAVRRSALLPGGRRSYGGGHGGHGGHGRTGYRAERYTLTLIVVVLTFVVCALPDIFLRVWLTLRICAPSLVQLPIRTLRYVNGVSNLCLTVNSSVNFLVYCVVGRRFRVVFMRVLCGDGVGLRYGSVSSDRRSSYGLVPLTGPAATERLSERRRRRQSEQL